MERHGDDLMKAIEADVVIPEKARVVCKYFLHSTGAQRRPGRRMKVDVGFGNRERMFGDGPGHVLIIGRRDVQWTGGQLQVKPELRIQVFVGVEANPIAASDVLQRRRNRIPRTDLSVRAKPEVAA